jgi:hypothetical protein
MSMNPVAREGQVNPRVRTLKSHWICYVFSLRVCGHTFSLQMNASQKVQDCLLPVGITSDNVAHRYGVTRQEQDQAAVSHLATDNFNFTVSSLR